MSEVNTIFAREPLRAGLSVFLAGPTPRSEDVATWRFEATGAIMSAWGEDEDPLNVLSPESRDGSRADEYHDQVGWEVAALDAADAIMFWIPRDLATLPGFTTNVEFGLYVTSGRVVLGCPPRCPNPERNRYLIWTAQRLGVPTFETLTDTVDGALTIVRDIIWT